VSGCHYLINIFLAPSITYFSDHYIEGFYLATGQEYCMSEYLAPESRWCRLAANLRLGSKGFLYQVCYFQSTDLL